jgi:hypothetical protein
LSFRFAPKGWALCNGQPLPINQNHRLFSLLRTTYGGDGGVNFALPELRGRTPIHMGSSHTLGDHDRRRAGRAPLSPPAEGKRVTIHVERMNPALQLYERLGFSMAEDNGVYLLLERQVNTAS